MTSKHPVLKSYVIRDFKKISQRTYGVQRGGALYEKVCAKALACAQPYTDITPAQKTHLYKQILPFIAVYQVMGKEDPDHVHEVLQTIIENRSRQASSVLNGLLKIPGLYKRVPRICKSIISKMFGEDAGFGYSCNQCYSKGWKADIVKCPYCSTCETFGCTEIAHYFCDSDDMIYGAMHPKIHWKRTKTLGRGDAVCDFCLEVE